MIKDLYTNDINKLFKGYYNPLNILKKDLPYNMVISKRSDGKTYAFKMLIWELWNKQKRPSIWVRRYSESLKPKMINDFFNDIFEDERLSNTYSYDGVVYRTGAFYGFWYNEKDKRKKIYDDIPFCYTVSLNAYENTKGTISIDNLGFIVFDEFLCRKEYLRNEYMTFIDLIGTCARIGKSKQNDDLTIVMLGNAVSWDSPYFKEFKLGDVKKLDKGIHIWQEKNSKYGIALEMPTMDNGNKRAKTIFSRLFPNNDKMSSTINGDWDLFNYPHITFNNKDDKYLDHFYIQLENNILKCSYFNRFIDGKSNRVYMFVSPTKEIKYKDKIVFTNATTDNHPYKFYNANTIFDRLFNHNIEVYFSDNEVGTMFDNFLDTFQKYNFIEY